MQSKLSRNVFRILVVAGCGAAAYGVTVRTPDIRMSGMVVQQPEYVEVDRTGYEPVVIRTEVIRMDGMQQ